MPGLRLSPTSPMNSEVLLRWEVSVKVTVPEKRVVKVALIQGALLAGGVPVKTVLSSYSYACACAGVPRMSSAAQISPPTTQPLFSNMRSPFMWTRYIE